MIVLEGITSDALCGCRCQRVIWGSRCVACRSAVGALYVMVSSFLCADVPMGNVFFTCLFGQKLGMEQGISAMRKSADSAVFLSDSTRRLGKDTARHACLIKHLFGAQKRSISKLLCDRLWCEDLSNTKETDELMLMATMGDAEENREVPLHLGGLHTVVRERLSFFLSSLRFVCEGEGGRHVQGMMKEEGKERQREKIVHQGIYRMSDVMLLSQSYLQ